MPTETWWNLPDEKRRRITEVAMAEFGARGFSAGSLNVVAREAGIAKGSLFQYFEDKLDFFATVCEAGAARIEAATVGDVDTDVGFWDLMRTIVRRWIEYFRDHPLEKGMAFAAANEIDREARLAVRSVTNAHYGKALRPLVDLAQSRGEIRSDADPTLVISMLTLVLRHLNTAPFEPDGDPAVPFDQLPRREVDRLAASYVDALERAFGV